MARVSLCLALLLAAAVPCAFSSTDPVTEKIIGMALNQQGAVIFLQELTDSVGGRMTGSPENLAAAHLILATLQAAGFDNAHLEEYKLDSVWHRGPVSAYIAGPLKRRLVVGSYGWVPGTPGPIEVPLVTAVVMPDGKFTQPMESFKGKAVLVDIQSDSAHPYSSGYVSLRAQASRQLGEVGAAAMLIAAAKPNRMVYTSGYGFYPRGPLPVLSIAKEDALLVQRLLAKGPVVIGLDVKNTFEDKPGTERNVVADLPGSGCNDVVVVGAHFDSWDLAQGADDNGSGVAAVLDAARILRATGAKATCTLRFVFFSGEEEANLGSRAYIKDHSPELDRTRAFLMMDEGSGAPVGLKVNGREDVAAAAKNFLPALAGLGVKTISLDTDLDSDNASFMTAGIPSLQLLVEEGDYDIRHHSISDTFDKINPHTLAMNTAVLAITAHKLADAKVPIARRLSPAEVMEFLRKNNLEKAQELQFGSLQQ